MAHSLSPFDKSVRIVRFVINRVVHVHSWHVVLHSQPQGYWRNKNYVGRFGDDFRRIRNNWKISIQKYYTHNGASVQYAILDSDQLKFTSRARQYLLQGFRYNRLFSSTCKCIQPQKIYSSWECNSSWDKTTIFQETQNNRVKIVIVLLQSYKHHCTFVADILYTVNMYIRW